MTSPDQSLADALRSIPGVADAEVDEGDAPNGVRVRLAPDADAAEVAVAVREVLAGRGLRGRLAPSPQHVVPEGPPPPPATDRDATIIPGPGWIGQPSLLEQPDEEGVETAPVVVEPGPEDHPGEEGAGGTPTQEGPAVEVSRPPLGGPVPSAVAAGLARVVVEEGRETLSVTAYARNGGSATRSARTSPEGFHQAVVGAVAGLVDPGNPTPRVVAVRDDVVAEGRIITVVLEGANGSVMVGSSMVGAERAFALARAAWAALTDAT